MTDPNEFGDRWCCEPCKRLAEAAADEKLAAAKLASQLSSPRHVVAMALHREHCGERPPEATHPADMDCHLIDADAALQALIAAGYTVLVTDPHATVNAGGGIASVSDIRAALALALDSLPEPEDGDHG